MELPEGPYLLKEFIRDIDGGHNIVSTVFVESESINKRDKPEKIRPVEETRLAHDIAEQVEKEKTITARVAAGIIGFADLTLGREVCSLLESHLEVSQRFRGIRQIAAWHENPDVFSLGAPNRLLDLRFREGFAYLEKYGLIYLS